MVRLYKVFTPTILGWLLIWGNSSASNLMNVYEAALASDPQFKIARARWLAEKENLAVSRASLFPQIAVQGNLARNRRVMEVGNGAIAPAYYSNSLGYGLIISQPIFDFKRLASLWGTQAVVRKSHAIFMVEEEQLLYRVAERYFNVLLAKGVLTYAKANRVANERFFTQSKHKYEVGLTAVTDLEESRRNYERALSIEIKSHNDLDGAFEMLNEMTGVRYTDLNSLKKNFPLLSPEPADVEAWVRAAERQNFELMAANFSILQAKENIKIQNANHFPTITFNGGYNYGYDKNYNGSGSSSRTKGASLGIEIGIPIFSGGRDIAASRQANYQYQGVLSEFEKKHREVVSNTRQAYLGVISSISKIKADIQAIKAAESALKSMQANYAVGRKTMSDVLDSQSKLYEVQTEYAKDEHSYILLLLKLKMSVGSLVINDLLDVNAWLENNNSISPRKNIPKDVSKIEIKTKKINKNKANRFQDNLISSKKLIIDPNRKNSIVVLDVDKIKPVSISVQN